MTRTSFIQQILNMPTSLLNTLDMISLLILTHTKLPRKDYNYTHVTEVSNE